MTLRQRIDRLANIAGARSVKEEDDARHYSALLKLATVKELLRLRDLLNEICTRLPKGTPPAEYVRYATACEREQMEIIYAALEMRRTGERA